MRRVRFDAAEALDLIERHRPERRRRRPDHVRRPRTRRRRRPRPVVDPAVRLVGGRPAAPTGRGGCSATARIGRVAGRGFGSAVVVDIFGMVELSGPGRRPRSTRRRRSGSLPAPSFAVDPARRDASAPSTRTAAASAAAPSASCSGAARTCSQGYEGARRRAARTTTAGSGRGDHGRICAVGLFQFAGRSKDRLKVGGFSVFPAEVEEELEGADGVAELAIVGVEDERLGERAGRGRGADRRVRRRRVPAPGRATRWPGTAARAEVVVVDALPRGNNGKLDRDGGDRAGRRAPSARRRGTCSVRSASSVTALTLAGRPIAASRRSRPPCTGPAADDRPAGAARPPAPGATSTGAGWSGSPTCSPTLGCTVVRANLPHHESGRRAPRAETVGRRASAALLAAARGRGRRRGATLGGRRQVLRRPGRVARRPPTRGLDVVGLVFHGYPLHPPGKPDQLRVDHWHRVPVPALFLQGDRDPFGTADRARAST